ncbi:MAG: hypothetical protein NWR72_05365 [Bacteroidia bacterium]|nr:hypothetical protein [Bacteroidia bacterium]
MSCRHHPVVIIPGDGGGNNGGGSSGSGGGGVEHPCDPDTVYFAKDVLPILISNCAMTGCHSTASHREGVILDSYANTIRTGDVEPGKPNNSEIYEVLFASGEKRMPPLPAARLSQDQSDIIKRWIEQGAQDLSCDDACDTSAVTYSGDVRPLVDNYCTGCHSGSSAGGGIQLADYAGLKAIADNGSLFGSINHDAGYKAMPQGGDKLDACSIATIKIWIAAGSPQN